MNNRNIAGLILIMSLVFVQCVPKEEEINPADRQIIEMPEFPAIEDPEPVIEEPKHEELFMANLSIDVLKEMESTSTGEGVAPTVVEIFEILETHINVD